jgi:hypothetical protein
MSGWIIVMIRLGSKPCPTILDENIAIRPRRHDIQHNDTEHNGPNCDTQHKNTQLNDTRH